MRCSDCNRWIPNNARYCQNCGSTQFVRDNKSEGNSPTRYLLWGIVIFCLFMAVKEAGGCSVVIGDQQAFEVR
jgi:hypothetical protein